MRAFVGAWGLVLFFGLGAAKGLTAPGEADTYRKSRLTNDRSEALADKRHLLLATGEDKAVDLDFEVNAGVNGISYGNPQVVTTTLVRMGDKRQLIFKPLKAGETTVTLRDEDGTIRLIFLVKVTGSNLLRVAGEVRSLLRDIEGLLIRIVGSKIVLEGELLVPNDYGRLITVVMDKDYEPFLLNLSTLSPLAMGHIARRIEADIKAFAPNVTARVVNGVIFLEGTVENPDQAKKAAELANLYIPEIRPSSLLDKDTTAMRLPPRRMINNFIVVNPAPPKKQEKMVQLTFHFVELAKDYDRIFAFKWMPGFTSDPQISLGQTGTGVGASGTGTSGGPTFTATISSLIPRLKSSQTAGYARVLRTATLIVRSGQPGQLNEQTQFPFVQQGQNGALTTSNVAIGLVVSVTPLILGASEDIQLDVDLSQTNLVGRGATVGAPPVTAVNKIKTKIHVRSNESAALGGVTSSDVGTDFNKNDPATGTFSQGTDALFTLLRSKSFQKKKSQFVIFVTPQILENASEGIKGFGKEFFREKLK